MDTGPADFSPGERFAPADRVSFFDEQKRRRRGAWIMSGLCLLIASLIGVVLSSILTPMLLLAGGGLLRLAAWMGIYPAAMRDASLGLGHWAQGYLGHFEDVISSLDHVNALGDLGVTVAPLLRLAPASVPALIAAALVWILMYRLSVRGDGGELVAHLHARPPKDTDLEERQLANIVAEMAIAAGLPTPRVLLVDSPDINAAAFGATRDNATVLVTRGLLDHLDRDETTGIVAHLVASIGAGDIRVSHGILGVFQTLGFFITILDLPFRWSAWRALGGLLLVALGIRRAPAEVERTLSLVEQGNGADAMPDVDTMWSVIPYPRLRKILLVPLLPFLLISLILRVALFLWTSIFLGPPLGMIWRNRRYAADAMAVQLSRNPDGLSRALSHVTDIPEGGENRAYCFIHQGLLPKRRGLDSQRTIIGSLHPMLGRRVQRLAALGASSGRQRSWLRRETFEQHPVRALLVVGLLLLLAPLLLVLAAAVLYLTAMAMTMALAAGLGLAAGILG